MVLLKFTQNVKKSITVFIEEVLPGYYPLILLAIILMGIVFAIFINRIDYAVRGLIIAVPALIVSIFLIMLVKDNSVRPIFQTIDNYSTTFNHRFQILIFILIFILSILTLFIKEYRPWYYFALIALLFSIIFYQIIQNGHPYHILGELFFVTLNLIYGVTLKYPLFFGATDVFDHLYYSGITQLSGHVIPTQVDISYANYPLYHIFIAISTLFSGLPLYVVYCLVTAIVYSIVLFFVYKLFFFISTSTKIALIGCLLYSASSIMILYGTYVVTRVFAYVGFIIILYLLFKLINTSTEFKNQLYVLLFLESIFLILVHQVSLYQILVLLIILYICEKIIDDTRILHLNYLLSLSIAFLAYQIFTATDFFTMIIKSRYDIFLHEDITMVRPAIERLTPYYYLTTNIHLAIFAFFFLLGIGYILLTGKSKYISAIAIFTLITSIFYLPNPFQLSYIFAVYFRIDRLMLLLTPFFALVAAIGLFFLFNHFLERKIGKQYLISLFLSLIFIYSFASISLANSSDCKDFWWYQESDDYLNAHETDSLHFINHVIPYGSILYSDYVTQSYFNAAQKNILSNKLKIPYFDHDNLDFSNEDNGYSIIRTNEFIHHGLEFPTTIHGYLITFQPTTENIQTLKNYSFSRNKIFENDGVQILENNKKSLV